jgi:hypothetical protein
MASRIASGVSERRLHQVLRHLGGFALDYRRHDARGRAADPWREVLQASAVEEGTEKFAMGGMLLAFHLDQGPAVKLADLDFIVLAVDAGMLEQRPEVRHAADDPQARRLVEVNRIVLSQDAIGGVGVSLVFVREDLGRTYLGCRQRLSLLTAFNLPLAVAGTPRRSRKLTARGIRVNRRVDGA